MAASTGSRRAPRKTSPRGHIKAPDPLLLRPAEAAQRLGVSRTKLYDLMAQGRLPFVLLGRSRRIPAAALPDFIRSELLRQGFLP